MTSTSSAEGDKNYHEAKKMLKNNFDDIRYVFSTLFSKIYSRINDDGRQLKSRFEYNFSSWLGNVSVYQPPLDVKHEHEQEQSEKQAKIRNSGKNIEDYKNRVFAVNEFEQKPLKNDLVDILETLETDEADALPSQKIDVIEVKNEKEINSFVKVKPMNDVKKKFLKEREQRKHEKLMKKKKKIRGAT